jgi:hypothetical protein
VRTLARHGAAGAEILATTVRDRDHERRTDHDGREPARPAPPPVHALEALQRSAGNQAVGRMLARIIKVGGVPTDPAQVKSQLDGLTPKPAVSDSAEEWLRLMHRDTRDHDFTTIDVLAGQLKGTAVASTTGARTGTARDVAPGDIRFSQKDVGAETSDGLSLDALTNILRTSGWDTTKDPIDVVDVPGLGLVSIDNRRIVAARNAGLATVPTRVHHYNDALDLPPARISDGFTLKKYKIKLLNGQLVRGGTKGTIVYEPGDPAETWGEAVLFRTIDQGGSFAMYGTLDLPKIRAAKTTASATGGTTGPP